MIGKTEEVILLTLIRCGESSPAVVAAEIRKITPIHLGAVYTILTRMADKGWVKRRGSRSQRGRGHPRTFFTITPAGRKAVRNSIDITNQFKRDLDL